MTKKVEDLKTIQETEDNQITELSDKDLDNVVGGNGLCWKNKDSFYTAEYTKDSSTNI